MSGGVDSSVAALLTKESGDECIGATMKLYNNEDIGVHREKTCCSLDDVEDARSVAYQMDMPYYVFNFTADFHTEVMDRFVDAYENGCTPNPCIDCNRYLKFDKMFHRMQEIGYDYIVTGHYARVEYDEKRDRYLLKKAVDDTKDQSYVLYMLTQEQLAHVKLPLGGLRKEQVRVIAEKHGFINARKHDSQDICFVPDGDYAKFIEKYTGKKTPEGDFVDKEGNAVPNANIAVFSENPQFVITDDYGYFYVGNLERGKHELYYIEKSDVNKTKEEIKKNAIDSASVTTSSENEIIFEGGFEITSQQVGEETKKTIKITLVKNNGEKDEDLEKEINTRYESLPTLNKLGYKFLYWKDEN